MMKQLFILSFAIIALTACSEAQTDNGKVINKVVAAAEFKKLMDKPHAQLIDVRTPQEYAAGKIGDAKNIDFYNDNFKAEMSKLDHNKPVLVYCASGGRSGKTASMLKGMGFKEVYDLQGGYRAWSK